MKLFNKPTPRTPTEKEIAIEKETEEKTQIAYLKSKRDRRIENAKRAGQIDADRLANQKPFYQKVMGALVAVGKDLVENAPNTDSSVLFNWDEPNTRKKQHRGKK